jgi:hypothetical protein
VPEPRVRALLLLQPGPEPSGLSGSSDQGPHLGAYPISHAKPYHGPPSGVALLQDSRDAYFQSNPFEYDRDDLAGDLMVFGEYPEEPIGKGIPGTNGVSSPPVDGSTGDLA